MAVIGDSILQYGGVSLPFVKTEKFVQELIYSPDGVDGIYSKITIGVGCVLNDCSLGMPVSEWYVAARPLLMQRGLQLYYVVDGEFVLPASSNPLDDNGDEVVLSPRWSYNGGDNYTHDHDTDAKLGPKPVKFEVKEIAGGTWLAYYEIVTYIPYCESSSEPSIFLSNRWESSIDVDEKYFMTRTMTGTLILNGQYESTSQVYTGGLGVALMVENNIIIPPCPKRWKRDTIKIVRSQDSLVINYTITDRQLYSAMPRPATKIDANYTETSGTPGVAHMNILICECQVLITGEPNANFDPTSTLPDSNKYDLIKLMFQIVFSRIKFPFTQATDTDTFDTNEFITYFQMKEDMFMPIVGCTVRCLRTLSLTTHPIGKNALWQSNVWELTNIGEPVLLADIQDDIARQPDTLGNYGMFLISANALKYELGSAGLPLTPCDDYELRSINQTAGVIEYTGNTTIYTTLITTAATDLATAYYDVSTGTYWGDETYKHPFTEYNIDVSYQTANHLMQLPFMYDVDSDDPSCVFAQTAAPTSKKTVTWTAGRLGKWPIAPDPENAAKTSSDPAVDKLLDYNITFKDTELMSDGITRKYMMGGIYEVGMLARLQWDADPTPTAVNPKTYDVWGSAYNTFPATSFVTGIVGYGPPGSPPGGAQV